MVNSHTSLIEYSNPAVVEYRQEMRQRINDALASLAVRRVIGVSGDADPDKQAVTQDIVEEFATHFIGGDYAILTGGTEGGVPQMGVETAKRLGIPTIGVFPKQGTKYALLSQLDLAIETSPPDIGDGTFGTETPAFVNMLDGATVIGGGYGTLTEISTILKTNTPKELEIVLEDFLTHKILFILHRSPRPVHAAAASVYNLTHNLGGDMETSLGMPISPAIDGHDAAKFIYDRLNADIE